MTLKKRFLKRYPVLIGMEILFISSFFFIFCLVGKDSPPKLTYINDFLNFYLFKEIMYFGQSIVLVAFFRYLIIPELDIESNQHGSTRWLTHKEFKKTVTEWDFKSEINKGGQMLGIEIKDGKPYKGYFDCGDVHNLIIAATRSGKTRKLLLETIMNVASAGESMVINDPKGENYLITYPYLKDKGYNIICIDFREPLKSNYWNPLYIINNLFKKNEKSLAVECAFDLASIICPIGLYDSDSAIFKEGAQSIVAGAIIILCTQAEKEEQINMSSLIEVIHCMSDETGSFYLDHVVRGLPSSHPAKKVLYTAFSSKGNLRPSMFTNAMAALRLFTDATIETMCSKQDHDMEAIGREKTALFIILPDEKTTRHPLATIYFTQLYQILSNYAIKNGSRLPKTVHMLYDEFGNSPVQPDFPQKITIGAGRGILYTLIVQSLEQLDIYGIHGSNTIKTNIGNWLYLSTNNPSTAEIINKKIGTETIITHDLKYKTALTIEGEEGKKLMERDMLKVEEIMRWDINKILVLRQGKNPIALDLLDFSKYHFSEECGMVGIEKEDQKILQYRNMNREIHKEINVPIWKPKLKKTTEIA